MNPLIADWTSPFQMPPFGAISDEDFEPAFDAAFEHCGTWHNVFSERIS